MNPPIRIACLLCLLPSIACADLFVSDDDRAAAETMHEQMRAEDEARAAEAEQAERDAKARMQAWVERAGALSSKLAEVGKLAPSCSKEQASGTIATIDDKLLASIGKAPEGIVKEPHEAGRGMLQSWSVRDAFYGAHLFGTDWSDVAVATAELERADKLAIFVITDETLPIVADDKQSYTPGSLNADLAVFDSDSSTPLCRIPLKAKTGAQAQVTEAFDAIESSAWDMTQEIRSQMEADLRRQGDERLTALGAVVTPCERKLDEAS